MSRASRIRLQAITKAAVRKGMPRSLASRQTTANASPRILSRRAFTASSDQAKLDAFCTYSK